MSIEVKLMVFTCGYVQLVYVQQNIEQLIPNNEVGTCLPTYTEVKSLVSSLCVLSMFSETPLPFSSYMHITVN